MKQTNRVKPQDTMLEILFDPLNLTSSCFVCNCHLESMCTYIVKYSLEFLLSHFSILLPEKMTCHFPSVLAELAEFYPFKNVFS